MKASSGALAALALLFAAACTTTKAGPPPPAPPVIKTFSADQTQVSPGAMVKLTFTTADAKEVSLIDQTGMEVPVTGSVESGQATVMPTRTSFYVLRVTGDGGKDSAFVQVAVNEGLKQVFLIAVPTEISSGESVELVWSALGGTNVSVKDSSGMTVSTAESGTTSATPEKTTTWTLRADGSTGMLSATARVTVRPVIKEFSASPPAARQGQKIQLQWRTAGADGVVVKEATFGTLVTTATDVVSGTYAFSVPSDFDGPSDGGTLPDGGTIVARPVPDNFPLRFTLTARSNSPMQEVSAALDSVVRDGPVINTFDAPTAVTENKPFTLKWSVSAFRTQILLEGAPIFATVPPAIASSTLTLPGISADTTVTLVAYDYLGLKVSQSKLIKAVKAPKVVTFTLPTTVATAGGSASAAWTTTNASVLVLRIKNGPAVFTTSTAAMVT
ncbi:MAG: OmpA/MotB protein, partial [Myxococcaceae bacterium]|nr:OmpA/MotB protein [Myxococcaceae bacterium]